MGSYSEYLLEDLRTVAVIYVRRGEMTRAALLLALHVAASSAALVGPVRPQPSALVHNGRMHTIERAEACDGYGYGLVGATDDAAAQAAVRHHPVPPLALGMGSKNAAFGDECGVYATEQPLFTREECASLRKEAESNIASGTGASSFTMTDSNRDVAVHEMAQAQHWLNSVGVPRLASLAAACFPSTVRDATELHVYRSLVIQYEAVSGLAFQPLHRDGCFISCIVALSDRSEYDGGGTYIEALEEAIALNMGHVLLHPGALRHAGHRITAGERWVLVVFLSSKRMRYGDHVRRFKARAAALGEEGDRDGERLCLQHALHVSEGTDHEIVYDLGTIAQEAGEEEEAIAWYELAYALNARDPMLLNNLGAAYLVAGRYREAFRCFRSALEVDAYDVNAMVNALELLHAVDRLSGCRHLIAAAPAEVLADPEVEMLVQQVEATKSSS